MLKRVIESPIIQYPKRFFPLCFALWVAGDMISDANQLRDYYHYSFEDNTSYNKWSMQQKNVTRNEDVHKVSPAYFLVSCFIWITPPFLFSMYFQLKHFYLTKNDDGDHKYNPFGATNHFADIAFNRKLRPFSYGIHFNILVAILFLPVDMLVSSIYIYMIIPLSSIKSSLIIACKGSIDKGKDLFLDIDNNCFIIEDLND